MERFLKAKHWQIFLLTFGLPYLLQAIVSYFLFSDENPLKFMKIMPFIMVFMISGILGWFWAVAIKLQSKIPAEVKMKVRKFKIFFFIPLIYILFILGSFGFMFTNVLQNGQLPSGISMGLSMLIIFPLHLFSMFCIMYSFYFAAKTFKTVELQREVEFSDFAGEFFLFWFFPIGIWVVQPKINKMIELYAEKK